MLGLRGRGGTFAYKFLSLSMFDWVSSVCLAPRPSLSPSFSASLLPASYNRLCAFSWVNCQGPKGSFGFLLEQIRELKSSRSAFRRRSCRENA